MSLRSGLAALAMLAASSPGPALAQLPPALCPLFGVDQGDDVRISMASAAAVCERLRSAQVALGPPAEAACRLSAAGGAVAPAEAGAEPTRMRTVESSTGGTASVAAGAVSLTGAVHPSLGAEGRLWVRFTARPVTAVPSVSADAETLRRWLLLMRREVALRRDAAVDRLADGLVLQQQGQHTASECLRKQAQEGLRQATEMRRELGRIAGALSELGDGLDRLIRCMQRNDETAGCGGPFFSRLALLRLSSPVTENAEATCPQPPEAHGLAEALRELEDLECVSRRLEDLLVGTLGSDRPVESRPGAASRYGAEIGLGAATIDLEPLELGHVYRPLFEVAAACAVGESERWSWRLRASAGIVAGNLGESTPVSDRWRFRGLAEMASAEDAEGTPTSSVGVRARIGLEHAEYLSVEGGDPDPLRLLAECSLAPRWRLRALRPGLALWVSTAISGGHLRAGLAGTLAFGRL